MDHFEHGHNGWSSVVVVEAKPHATKPMPADRNHGIGVLLDEYSAAGEFFNLEKDVKGPMARGGEGGRGGSIRRPESSAWSWW